MPLVAPLWIESEDLGFSGVGFKAFLRLRPKPFGFSFFLRVLWVYFFLRVLRHTG